MKRQLSTSEYCAVGHPDRTCDYIASHILDRYLHLDPNARVALEVQLKDNYCTISGEVTSAKADYKEDEIADMCRDALADIGYDAAYADRFGKEHVVASNDLNVTTHISRQSPDIAQGVAKDGWGDQGIFWGLAVDDQTRGYMPLDYWLARRIANELYSLAISGSSVFGIDIKTLVTTDGDKLTQCVVAIPIEDGRDGWGQKVVESEVRHIIGDDCPLIINGTGRYVTHGSVGDCGTTGRKLVADFYGGNSRIGGGSPWGKDPSKADVALNYLARRKALDYLLKHPGNGGEIRCSIACCIGQGEVLVSYYDRCGELLESSVEAAPPSQVIGDLGLRLPNYARRCREGLFGYENVISL